MGHNNAHIERASILLRVWNAKRDRRMKLLAPKLIVLRRCMENIIGMIIPPIYYVSEKS